MGKLRLKLQNMMPHVWYRRLKLELTVGISRAAGAGTTSSSASSSHLHAAINYKRWSSQRKLAASKKLIKAASSPLITTKHHLHKTPLRVDERETTHLPHQRVPPSHAPSISPSSKEREIPPLPQCQILHTQREIAPQERETPSLAQKIPLLHAKDGDTHGFATSSSIFMPHQAPSLSSPQCPPISDKGFHLNLQELETKLKALTTQERRRYFSGPMFSIASSSPTTTAATDIGDKCVLETFNSPVSLRSSELNDDKFAARKLFCEEIAPFNEGSRSSHGSASFTGQSMTSSDDTALDRASSSSIWERDLSSLTSEGSELFSAIEEIQNTVASLRRKTQRGRRDTPGARQRKRSKEAKCKVMCTTDDYSCIDDATFCNDANHAICPLQTPLVENDMQLAQAQSSMCALDPEIQDGDDFVGHRRSFSNEVEGVGWPLLNSLGGWQYDGCDNASPIQCSDSAFSDSELDNCRVYRRDGMQQKRYSKQIPKQGNQASILYNDIPLEVPQSHRRKPCDAESRHPSLSKSRSTCRSLHSSVCDCYNNLLSSKRANFDAKACHSPLSKSRGTCRRGADANSCNYPGSSLDGHHANTDVIGGYPPSPPCNGTSTWRPSNECNQAKGYPKSLGTWKPSNCDNRGGLRLLKSASKRLPEGDYDGDESLHSYSSTVASLSSSYSRREADGNVSQSVTSLSKSPSALRPAVNGNSICDNLKSASKGRLVDDSYDGDESLHSYKSVSAWSKRYSSRREVDGNECNSVEWLSKEEVEDGISVASMSKSCTSKREEGSNVAPMCKSYTSKREIEDGSSVASMSKSYTSKREIEDGSSVPSMSKSYTSKRESKTEEGADKSVARKGEDRDGKKGDSKEALEKGGHECWYKGGLRVVKEKGVKDHSNIEKSKVYESFAMVKCSNNPSLDFKESMMEMILHKKLHESMDLVELLQCYLALNSPHYHDTIVKSFIDLWSHLFRPSH